MSALYPSIGGLVLAVTALIWQYIHGKNHPTK